MGTRQLRLSDPAIVKVQITNFIGRKITVILLNNTSMFGVLNQVANDNILLTNMRRKKMKFALSEISEVYLDTEG